MLQKPLSITTDIPLCFVADCIVMVIKDFQIEMMSKRPQRAVTQLTGNQRSSAFLAFQICSVWQPRPSLGLAGSDQKDRQRYVVVLCVNITTNQN